jgi:hypothetical protein
MRWGLDFHLVVISSQDIRVTSFPLCSTADGSSFFFFLILLAHCITVFWLFVRSQRTKMCEERAQGKGVCVGCGGAVDR